MIGFSIIMPCESSRTELLLRTLDKYASFNNLVDVEFLVISRTMSDTPFNNRFKLIRYSWDGEYFSTSMPLNIGIRNAKYDNIIITCPEVMPKTNVIEQLSNLPRGNYVCQVFDQNEKGEEYMSLVNSGFRSDTPAMYFLACFKREDLFSINGWDEDFMGTYAYEDDDFGHRFVRAGLEFSIRDEIQGIHQYHPRGYPNQGTGFSNAIKQLNFNDSNNIIRPRNGLEKI